MNRLLPDSRPNKQFDIYPLQLVNTGQPLGGNLDKCLEVFANGTEHPNRYKQKQCPTDTNHDATCSGSTVGMRPKMTASLSLPRRCGPLTGRTADASKFCRAARAEMSHLEGWRCGAAGGAHCCHNPKEQGEEHVWMYQWHAGPLFIIHLCRSEVAAI